MIHPDQRVGVFIDTQNMYYSARNVFGKRVNFKNIVLDATGKRKLIRAIAYVVKTKTQEESPFFEALEKMGIELREKELKEYLSGAKKADWDVGITIDVVRCLDMLDVIVLVSGDSDYIPLVHYAQSRGRIVEVMAFRETTSSQLIEEADAYHNLSEESRRYLMGSSHEREPMDGDDRTATETKEEEIENSATSALKPKRVVF
ncbi:NYN domain-containing protein [Candidatus Uhrbacteria bacterium]|nr:NYN domain-containing protein [Candidatus Uhrbacteria bacterium]